MPNHLHGILFISNEETADGTPSLERAFDAAKSRLASGSPGVIIGQFKRAATIRSKSLKMSPEQPIWQRNYYEHIVRNENSLNDIRKYIDENPARWGEDSLYVE